MIWFTTLFLLALAIVLGAWFLHRYFAKATLETALVRTGMGGRKVVIDGGCLALPIFHRLQKVSMAAIVVPVSRSGSHAVMCMDRLRADIYMEFELRVEPSADGISTAAQSLGTCISRPGEATQELLTSILIDAIQNAAASRKLDDIRVDRNGFTQQVADAVAERVSRLGLQLVSASPVSADQAALAQHDENIAFQAQGTGRGGNGNRNRHPRKSPGAASAPVGDTEDRAGSGNRPARAFLEAGSRGRGAPRARARKPACCRKPPASTRSARPRRRRSPATRHSESLKCRRC